MIWPPSVQLHLPPLAAEEDQLIEILQPPYLLGPDPYTSHRHTKKKNTKRLAYSIPYKVLVLLSTCNRATPCQALDVIISGLVGGSHDPVCQVLHHLVPANDRMSETFQTKLASE